MPRNEWTNSSASPRRRRFQRGSLQKRKSAGSWNWIVFWWQDRRRRGQILGPCSTMSRPEALAEMATLLQLVNIHAGERISRNWTVAEWIRDMFLPLCRRKWKLSTASTTGDRIRKHLITDLGSLEIQSVTRELLQTHACQSFSSGRYRSQTRRRSARPRIGCESGRLHRRRPPQTPRCGGGVGTRTSPSRFGLKFLKCFVIYTV